jgi:hypothetical protein
MSVELYIYPQSYADQQAVPIDYLADYQWTTLNASYQAIEANEQDHINTVVPISTPYTFYRWGVTAAGYPMMASNELILPGNGGVSWRATDMGSAFAVYYQARFEYVINSDPLTISLYDGTTQTASYTFPAGVAGATAQWGFYVQNPTTTICISAANGDVSATKNWRIQNYVAPTLSDGQVLIDLFDEKQIPLTLSVDNFQNAAEKTQSYSKAFKLPGTDRNNKIFRNIFDITSVTKTNSIDFNPYRKTNIVLQEDGSTIFKGFLRMISIDYKNDNIIYNVSLYSETIKIKDELKGKKFYDIDMTELTHAYSKAVIKSSWDNTPGLDLNYPLPAGTFAGTPGAMTTTVLKYPFVDWTHQATVANNPGAPPASGPADGLPQFASLGQMFRPWISCRYLIDRIFEGVGYTWTSTFLQSADFENIYMDFNWGANRAPMIGANMGLSYWKSSGAGASFYCLNSAWTNIPLRGYYSWTGFSFLLPNYNSTTNQYVSTTNYTSIGWNNSYLKWENTGAVGVNIIVEIIKNGGLVPADVVQTTFFAAGNSNGSISMNATFLLQAGDVMEQQWITANPGDPQTVRVRESGSTPTVKTTMTEIQQNMTTTEILMTKRGKMKQWDFLKGIIKTFNLLTVADPTNSKNIIIEKYDTIFPPIGTAATNALTLADRGIKKDWTDKIDVEKFNYKPMKSLKKTTLFKYKTDSSDYTATNYKNAFGGFEYGSLSFDASDFTLLTGETKIEASPFAATLNKPFGSTTPELWTPAIYKLKDDGTGEEFDNKPRLCYFNGRVTMATGTYYIPPANGGSSENANTYCLFSGFSDYPILPTSNDLNFGTCQLIGADNPSPLNLFNRFFASYYFDLYNPDTRTLKLKIKLTGADINQFSFSDIVMIKNRAYRVSKINYNPGQVAKVELILIP